jgi:hypothetical protein
MTSKAKQWMESIDPGHDLPRNIRSAMIMAYGVGQDEGMKEVTEMVTGLAILPNPELDDLRKEMDTKAAEYAFQSIRGPCR